jgi:hypothetical protein
MKKVKHLLSVFALLFSMLQATASADSCGLRISLLTCTPGSELYSVFGHSALRIVDSTVGTDIVYNFGTFDFNDPSFYSKFVRGKLMYFLSQETFENFKYEYAYFKRGITEQVLSFNCAEKKLIQTKLFENMQEANRYYKYDFLKDNCTTRLRDLIFGAKSMVGNNKFFGSKTNSTYRDYLHNYLNRAAMPWTKLGIDLLLGFDAEHRMNVNESMFLPDYLQKGVSLARLGNKNLVSEEVILVDDLQPGPTNPPYWETPFFFFNAILVLFAVLGGIKNKKSEKLIAKLDIILFVIVGILGIVLMFMWLGTDHASFRDNLNLIWALPTNLLAAFFINAQHKWVKKYFLGYSVLTIGLGVLMISMPGSISISLIPLIILLSYRAWLIGRNDKKTLKQ